MASESPIQCQECAYDNAAGSRFCSACGIGLKITCAACRHDCPPGAKFCGWCGAALTGPTQPPKPHDERKQATVLFADIVGSTELIAGLDAEAVKDRLEPLVKAMTRAVLRFDGTVLRSLGDGIKAAFGVPHTQEGHALLACQAALAMQAAIAALSATTKIRIGLHSGEVVAGPLDTGSAVEQEAQGMTVHLASRIEHAAEPGEIWISGECRALIGASCDTVPLGVVALRGIAHPVAIYRLTGLRPAVNSDHFRGASLTPLRGRAADLAVLQQAVLHAGDPAAINVFGIAAPAGIGKSRLCFEFGEWCRARHIAVLEARGQVFGQATPLLPVLEVLRTFFRIIPLMDAATARRNIADRLLALDPTLADGVPLIADFLNIADPAEPAPVIDPRARHARLREVVARIVKAVGRRRAVLIVEDLHWLDEASHDFVETLVQAVHETNIVMVVTFRPEWSAPWAVQGTGRQRYRELRLTELDRHDMRRLVADLAALEPAIVHVVDQSGGNPLFAEELVLSLVQTGVLVGAHGDYHLAKSDWRDSALPATVEAVIGARIDRLTERQKAVLQIGSVIGKEFPAALVREVAAMPEPALQTAFEHLHAAGMIQPCATDAGPGFAFRHPLIQEVAYAMQLRTRRTRLHEDLADAIKRFDWGLRDEFAGLLAHHYEAAGQALAAANHLLRAARWIGRTNSARALSDLKKVRRMMQGQPNSETNDQLRALTGGQLLTFGWREGMPAEEAKLYAEEALHYARAVGNRKHEVLLLGAYGRIVAATGCADEYVRLVREALVLTDATSNPEGTLLLHGLLCQAYGHAGLFAQALDASDAAFRLVDDGTERNIGVVLGLSVRQMVGFDVVHWIRCLRARLLVMVGRLDEAETALARVMQNESGKIEPFHQSIPHFAAVELAWHRGDTASARLHAGAVTRYAEESAMPYVSVVAHVCHGLTASITGDFAAAEPQFRSALTIARRTGAGLELEARLLALLADTTVRAGDYRAASLIAADAITAARRRTDRYAECHAAIIGTTALAASRHPGWQPEAAALLDRAETLIGVTTAAILRPMLVDAQRLVSYGR